MSIDVVKVEFECKMKQTLSYKCFPSDTINNIWCTSLHKHTSGIASSLISQQYLALFTQDI